MQTVSTLPAIVRAGYIVPDAPTVLQDAYRQHCAKKKLPYVTISRSGRAFLVTMDMQPTGGDLNAIGHQALQQLAFRVGSVTPISEGIKAYSLNTAQTLAKKLLNIGKDKRFLAR